MELILIDTEFLSADKSWSADAADFGEFLFEILFLVSSELRGG